MDRFKLSEDEQRFVDNVSAAAAFHPKPDGPDGLHTTIIRGELLQRILLKLPVLPHRSDAPFVVAVPTGCVELKGAVISGPFKLRGACAPDGGPLFGLRLEQCHVSEAINLSGAHIRSVSLRGSKIVHLDASEATVVNSLDISGISAAGDESLCCANLRGIRVGGSVIASDAMLVGPAAGPQLERFSQPAFYALDLRSCSVSDSVVLCPNFSATGAVSVASGEIGNEVCADGAELTGLIGWSFDGNGSRINGSLTMRGYDVTETAQRQTSVTGNIRLRGAKVKGMINLSGASVERGGVDAQNCEVGGDFIMSIWGDVGKAFTATGRMILVGARIGGSLLLAGAEVGSLLAQNSEIGGDASLGGLLLRNPKRSDSEDPFETRSMTGASAAFDGATIVGSLELMGVHLKGFFSACNVSVGGSAFFCSDVSSSGHKLRFEASTVLCHGARIKGSLILAGATLTNGFGAENIHVGGDAVLSGPSKVQKPDGSFKGMSDHLEAGGLVNLEGAIIDGSLRFVGAKINSAPDLKAQESTGNLSVSNRGVVLAASRIGGDLDMRGAQLQVGIAAQEMDIKGSVLMEALLLHDGVIPFVVNAVNEVSFARARVGGQLGIAGGCLRGSFNAENAVVGANFQLCAWHYDPKASEKPLQPVTPQKLKIDGTVVLNGMKVGGGMDLTGCQIGDGFTARHLVVSGDVLLDALEADGTHNSEPIPFQSAALDFTGARIGGTLKVRRSPSSGRDEIRTDIKLIDMQVCALDDGSGEGWGEDAKLWMNGLDYRRLDGTSGQPDHDCNSGTQQWKGRLKSFFKGFYKPETGSSNSRLKWLARQYENKKEPKDVSESQPETYERLSRYYRQDGFYEDALSVTSRQLDIERKFMSPHYGWIHWLFGAFFDYGLSPRRALLTFVGFILIGTATVWIARDSESKFMVVDTVAVRTLAVDKGNALTIALQYAPKDSKAVFKTDEIACGARINPLIYALDMAVPGLQLHQQDQCTFSTDYLGWLLFKLFYVVLGWIITAMTILTVSGIIRRQRES